MPRIGEGRCKPKGKGTWQGELGWKGLLLMGRVQWAEPNDETTLDRSRQAIQVEDSLQVSGNISYASGVWG